MNEHDECIRSDSILNSVKKCLGIMEEDKSFDVDITMHINAALSVLFQLGVLSSPYTVVSPDDTYQSMLPDIGEDVINQVKMYLVYRVRLGFDNSTMGSSVIEVTKDLLKETEWRLMVSFNPKETFE